MPVLVRVILRPLPGRAVKKYAHAFKSPGTGVDTCARFSKMGDDHSFDNPGHTKRHSIGIVVHIPFEKA